MCTKPRIIAPELIYEVTSRGARGTNIFPTDELKCFFLKELAFSIQKFSFQCFAWNIMDDHYHLVVKSSDITISKFMQQLNSIYAKHFNKTQNASGVVFHSRFASIVLEDTKLRELIRYVHLNPVRSGKCSLEELSNYEWCGHKNLVNKTPNQFQNYTEVLKLFSGPDTSISYINYVCDCHYNCDNDLTIQQVRRANNGIEGFHRSEPWILGCNKFVEETITKDTSRRLRIARYIRKNITFDIIKNKVVNGLNLHEDDLYRQGRCNIRAIARILFSRIGNYYDFSITKIAEYLNVSDSAISRMLNRYMSTLKENPTLVDIFSELKVEKYPETAVSINLCNTP